MAPLPCSPVSNSTASESQSQQATDDSDGSLTTPRPGPADASQRTAANLSRPSIPTYSSSPDSPKSGSNTALTSTSNKNSRWDTQADGQPRNPFTYGSSPDTHIGAQETKPQIERLQRSVSFTPQTSLPKVDRQGSYSSYKMGRKHSPNVSPHTEARNRVEDAGDSSADESTAIFPRDSRIGAGSRQSNYGAMAGEDEDEPQLQATGYDGGQEEVDSSRRRKPSSSRGKGARNASIPAQGQDQAKAGGAEPDSVEHEGWFKALVERYGSVELENKGSVARDHLALERTFLAWLRTSLSFASIGIAVTQLFRLNTSLSNSGSSSASASFDSQQQIMSGVDTDRLRHVGKPLGATFLGISILILLLGFHRYFESQHYVIRGKFPASRGTIILVSLVAFALIVASLVVVVAVAPTAIGKG